MTNQNYWSKKVGEQYKMHFERTTFIGEQV